jgi:hypothetical protein
MAGGLWDVADHRIAAQADWPRLFPVVGQTFRLPGDVYDTNTHFRFPDSLILRKGATVSAGALNAAAYPLTITNGQAIAVGFTGNIPTTASQAVAYTIQGGLGASGNYLSTTDVAAPQTFTVATGKPVIEFAVTTDAMAGAGGIDFSVGVSDAATTANIVKFVFSNGGGASAVSVLKGGTSVFTDNLPTGNHTVGLEFDAVAGTYRALLNGAPVVVSDDTYSATAAAIVAITAFENAGTAGTNAGKIFSAEARTESTTIAMTYGAGATDIGLNVLGASLLTSTSGTRTGSTSTGGHALTIAEMPLHDHDYYELVGGGATAGDGASNDGNPDQNQTRQTSQTGSGDAHSHTLDPLAVAVLHVVRVA